MPAGPAGLGSLTKRGRPGKWREGARPRVALQVVLLPSRRNSCLVVEEDLYVVPGSMPERVQYVNMDGLRLDCPWWIGLRSMPASAPLWLFYVSVACVHG